MAMKKTNKITNTLYLEYHEYKDWFDTVTEKCYKLYTSKKARYYATLKMCYVGGNRFGLNKLNLPPNKRVKVKVTIEVVE